MSTSQHYEEWKEAVMAPRPVLLVEDSLDDSLLILEMSRGFNIEFVVARNYKEAMVHLADCNASKRFSLAILDLNLRSEPSGEDLYYKIKEDCPLVPVLVLSGNVTVNNFLEMSSKGFVMFAMKPPAFTAKFFQEMYLALNIPQKNQKERNA